MRRVKDRYAELRRKAAGAPKSSEPEGQAYEVEPGVKVAERGGTGAYQVSTTDEDRIPLTTTVIPPSDSEYGPKLVHTHPRHIDRLMRKAGELHSDFAKEKDQDDHVSNLGRITWLLTNAMPLHRGSASVAEWYNMAVDRAKELKLGERKGKLDLEAFRRSQDEYAQNYRDIYTKEPDEE
jgi:hypothetical protein